VFAIGFGKIFLKDFFTKSLELNSINILLIALFVYVDVYNFTSIKNSIVHFLLLRFVALCIDYLTGYLRAKN